MAKKRSGQGIHKFTQSFRWKNFRGFADTADVRLKKLNIIIGANNSGKSSLIAPLLLLKQTAHAVDGSRPLITKGSLVHVGNYKDFVFQQDIQRTIELQFRYHGHETSGDKKPPIDKFSNPPGEIRIKLQCGQTPATLLLEELEILDLDRRTYLKRARQNNGDYTLEGPVLDRIKRDQQQLLPIILKQQPSNFLFEPFASRPWREDDKSSKGGDLLERVSIYDMVLLTAAHDIKRLFRELAYIGPMRERPARFYEHAGESPVTVGPRGAFAYEVLFRSPDSFKEKISDALKRLKLADGVECRELSHASDVFAVELKSGNISINLADAGFGISQILPILIQGYSDRRSGDSRLVIKQPEIHLNPAQQCVLAELLVEMMEKTSILIETHSEHILLSLRRLMALKKISKDDVGLHFVSRGLAGESIVREIEIEPNGHIRAEEWPKDFLGESLEQAFALAKAQSSFAK